MSQNLLSLLFTLADSSTEEEFDPNGVPPSTFFAIFGTIFAVMVVIALIPALISFYKDYQERKATKAEIEAEKKREIEDKERRRQAGKHEVPTKSETLDSIENNLSGEEEKKAEGVGEAEGKDEDKDGNNDEQN